jgi:D-alanine transaminase
MSRIVYVNGEFLSEEAARISVFDRGFLMADAVYEVTAVLEGKLLDFPGHLARLARSLSILGIRPPCDEARLLELHREILRRNRLREGIIYLQVSRGIADRDFVWPENPEPSLVMFTQARGIAENREAETGIRVASIEDIRWGRRDIKTVQLLAPSWAKMQARARGADDAWLVSEGMVNEGTSNNAWIVTRAGAIVTRALSEAILHGVTRAAVIDYARRTGRRVEERAFSLSEAKLAAEAFITASSTFVCPVVAIDGETVGTGSPGPVTRDLRALYLRESMKTAI